MKFLILDPHYTGSEDLGTIQNQVRVQCRRAVGRSAMSAGCGVASFGADVVCCAADEACCCAANMERRRANVACCDAHAAWCRGAHTACREAHVVSCGADKAWRVFQGKKNACSQIPSVGWHDVTVFRKDSFYNLCLPQRPTAI